VARNNIAARKPCDKKLRQKARPKNSTPKTRQKLDPKNSCVMAPFVIFYCTPKEGAADYGDWTN
jgi:hypothetical protein